MKFRFIGTGTSVGVPQIGCRCRVCTSPDSRDRRRRCGAYVKSDNGGFLIDTPPELRIACVEYGIEKVDAVVLTHAHMDHVAGFDDVRRFNTINGIRVDCKPGDPLYRGLSYRIEGKPMPCYAMADTIAAMRRIFPYISVKGGENGLYRPMIEFRDEDLFSIGDVYVKRLAVDHGFPCCGYLMGNVRKIAYISDCHNIPDDTIKELKSVDVLVLNCLRERPHPTHLSFSDAMAYISRISPGRAYLTHLCHDLTHEDWLEKLCGSCVEPAYDGLELEV